MATQRQRIQKYISDAYGVGPEYLWRAYPTFAIFRNQNNRKWFALLMTITRDKMGMDGTADIDVMNVHCPVDVVATLLPTGTFFPGYHMNKEKWVSIPLNNTLKDAQIIPLIDASFSSVAPRTKR